MVRYKSVVTSVGPLVPDFVEQGVLVLFAEGAPEELHEFSVLHRPEPGFDEVRAGDVVHIADVAFRVTAVGDVANSNLESLGHAVFKCNGRSKPEMPGDISLEESALVVPETGYEITIDGPE